MELSTVATRLAGMRVIPVLRLPAREAAAAAIDCLLEAGFHTVELTLTTPGAIDLISQLRRRMPESFLVGAGTVLDLETAQRCIDAGADYLVSPCAVNGMAALARSAARAALTGGFTPSEVLAAWREGASIVKLFPAASGGPPHLQALRSVFPDIPLCPTGGVSAANMLDYFKAGATVVGVGNNIIDQPALAAGDRAQVVRHARGFLLKAGQGGKEEGEG
jgi:2-dehydro-3-deoxyphosphogluconate aldolase / (4S)-4-hydroxy-2-oxoglutarate aldolase